MVQVTHNKVATTPDDPAFEVGQTEWNDAHAFIMASGRVLGRLSASVGSVEELTFTQVTSQLGIFTGVLSGLVPASGGGTANFLRADGTWVPAGGGTPGGTSGQVQFNNAGAFGGMSGTTWDNVNLTLTMTGFSITKDGVATVSSPTLNPSFNLSKGGVGSQLFWTGTDMGFFVGSVVAYAWNSTSYRFAADASLNWSNTVGNAITSTDIRLFRASAGNLAVGDGTTPQTLTINSTAAPAKLLDVQAVGVTKFSVSPTGAITGLNFTSGAQGLAPASGGGTTNFLRADGTWTAPAAGGGVPLTGNGATITVSTPLIDVSQTWNAAGVAFTAARVNVTNTASAAGSTLLDLQVASASKFNITKDGRAHITDTTDGAVMYSLYNNVNSGLGTSGAVGGAVTIFNNGTEAAWFTNNTITLGYAGATGKVQIPGGGGGADLWFLTYDLANGPSLHQDNNGILGIRQGTVAQSLRVYNTFTDASNYERGVMDWTTTANTLTIGAQKAGTGSARTVTIVADTTAEVDLSPGGAHFTCLNGGSRVGSGDIIGWAGGATSDIATGGGTVLRLSNVASAAVSFDTTGTGNHLAYMQWGGQARVTADFSVTSSAVLTNVTGLSVTVLTGRTYHWEVDIPYTCAAAGGIQAAMAGTATWTNIIYDGYIIDSGSNGTKGNTQATAIAAAVASTLTTGTTGHLKISGTGTCNAGGTLTTQIAQNTSNATPTIAKRGAVMIVHDMP